MKVNQTPSPVSFCKTLRATCELNRRNWFPLKCNIYQINTRQDKTYFSDLIKNKDWEKGTFVYEMDDEFNSNIVGERFYVLETKKGDCLGYIAMDRDRENKYTDEVAYIETCPKYQSKKKKRKIKYIGETLLAFAIKLANKKKTKRINIPVWSETAENFYTNCGFKQDENGLFIEQKQFKTLIKNNEAHTKSKIDLIQ